MVNVGPIPRGEKRTVQDGSVLYIKRELNESVQKHRREELTRLNYYLDTSRRDLVWLKMEMTRGDNT